MPQVQEDLWRQDAVIYAVGVQTFQDSDGDGIGDSAGLISRLDYLADLGIDCLWLLPFYPSPERDNGYDITDSATASAALRDAATARGIRGITDLTE